MSRPKSIDRDRVLDVAEDIVVRRGAAELTIDAGRREVYLRMARQWTEAAIALQMTPITGDALI